MRRLRNRHHRCWREHAEAAAKGSLEVAGGERIDGPFIINREGRRLSRQLGNVWTDGRAQGVHHEEDLEPFAARIHMPEDAHFSGYRTDSVELWFGPDVGDEHAYLDTEHGVERWPRADESMRLTRSRLAAPETETPL